MAISSNYDMQGAVSRGCVESAILTLAQEAIKNNQAIKHHFGFSDQETWEVGLTCGGEIEVLIEPLLRSLTSDKFLKQVIGCSKKKEPFYLLHCLDQEHLGKKILFNEQKVFYTDLPKGSFSLPLLNSKISISLPQIVEISFTSGENLPVFLQLFQLPPRVLIIGANDIAISLTKMAKLLGFSVIIIDPRAVFATQTRFPDADTILAKWPQDCLPALQLKKQDALVIISHDEKIDLPALTLGLENSLFYIGLLGSQKTCQSRFKLLKENGWKDIDLACIHAPIGLKIGSKKAEEIALSIISEIVKEKNRVFLIHS